MTPTELLAEARRLLDEATPSTVSIWARAAVLLCRQALEAELRELWAAEAPSLQFASMKAQLICLPAYLQDAELAGDVVFTWNALSRAAHHHPYELDPTREELDHLVTITSRLVLALESPAVT